MPEAVIGASGVPLRTLEEMNKRKPTTELGQEQFLKILMTQLANQNPMEPVNDTEFIAQLAQFSSLEQLQSLNEKMGTENVRNLVGKYVYVEVQGPNGTEWLPGKVDGVVKVDGVDHVIIEGELYPASKVVGVLDSDLFETEDTQAQDMLSVSSTSLIGKTITAAYLGEDGASATLTGVVEKIVIRNGMVYALVEGREIPVSDIEEISL